MLKWLEPHSKCVAQSSRALIMQGSIYLEQYYWARAILEHSHWVNVRDIKELNFLSVIPISKSTEPRINLFVYWIYTLKQ